MSIKYQEHYSIYIDAVFHLAAHTHVDLSFGSSYILTKKSVFGTHVLLESINKYGKVKRFYHISTNEVVHRKYGTLHSHRYLYAGDAAEAFDTILHKGEIGELYNVDS